MLTENHIKEGLSTAYINAVAFRAGFSCSKPTRDYGIDGSVNEIQVRPSDNRHFESGFGIDFQAKASENCVVQAKGVSYDLEVKNQHDLVETNRGRPLILIVLALPKNDIKWLETTTKNLVLRKCAWWVHLRGQAPSTNKTTERISIPLLNTFDVASLSAIMTRVKAGGMP